jgi:intermediate filament protein if
MTTRTRYGGDVTDGGGLDFTEGQYAMITATGVTAVKSSRESEKKEMQDLNDRFADYIEKVRNLEAQNRRLADELDKLRSKWGKETSQIKAMFNAELDDARHLLDDAEREKARLEIRVASLEDQIEEIRAKLTLAIQEVTANKEKVASQTKQISDYEFEVQMLRKQLEGLELEREKDQKTIAQLEEALARAREDLDSETLAHIDAENRRQTLEEEIEFLKSIHDQEMKELAALAYQDTTPESRDFWKNEMAQAIREIQQMYEDKIDGMRVQMESNYTLKLQDMRNVAARQSVETTKTKEDCNDLRSAVTDLRNKISDMEAQNAKLMRELEELRRAKADRERELEAENAMLRGEANGLRHELDTIMRELQLIMNTKMGLELEIAAYRKLLESEETRLSTKTLTTSDSWLSNSLTTGGGSIGGLDADKRGEMSAKTTYQRSAKGPIAVSDCPPDGTCVSLENTGNKVENLVGWKICRSVNSDNKPDYTLDKRFEAVKPGTKITIWAKGAKPPSAPSTDVELGQSSWGVGSLVITRLVNPEGEDRASLTQRTAYS